MKNIHKIGKWNPEARKSNLAYKNVDYLCFCGSLLEDFKSTK